MATKTMYKPSPIGIARYAWVNKPDTKYVTDGLYHVDLVLEGDDATAFKAEIDEEVAGAFTRLSEVMTEKAKTDAARALLLKGWTTYSPYHEEADDDGVLTGRVIFFFKQNAIIPLADGTKKPFKLGIRDGKNNLTTAPVYGGATIRTMFKPRDVKAVASKQLGTRLDFSMVQLIKAALPTGGGGGFDEVEGAYVDMGAGAADDTSEY
jgi:hypothetical protein